MEHSSSGTPPRPRRPRVEGGRSKAGCMTCVSRRVKCDEQLPLCGGCCRLNLQCKWKSLQPPLSTRRKGTGLVRDREKTDWKPSKILPLPLPLQNQTQPQVIYETSEDDSNSNLYIDSPAPSKQDEGVLVEQCVPPQILSGLEFPAANSWPEELSPAMELGSNSLPCTAPASLDFWTGTFPEEAAMSPGFAQQTWIEVNENRGSVRNYTSSTPSLPGSRSQTEAEVFTGDSSDQREDLSRSIIPLSSASTLNFPYWFPKTNAASPLNSFIPISDDSQALFYFRDTFARLKSMRNPEWSAHTVFLHYALQRQTAMHFLLAVSHHELVIDQGSSSKLPDEVRGHYETGSQLLHKTMTGQLRTDHMSVMLSFLYMYLFWIRRDIVHAKRLKSLSWSVYSYVQRFGLDSILKRDGSASTFLPSYPLSSLELAYQDPDETVISRLLVYLYDRDVYCSFYGCGGYFANFLNADEGRRKTIWTASRGSLQSYWGNLYPVDEIMQDIVDDSIQDMHFDLVIIQQLINDYSQTYLQDVRAEQQASLTNRLDKHQNQYSSIFQTVMTEEISDSSISLLAYIAVTLFYALRIYLLRCTSIGFGGHKSSEVQDALQSLISVAHRTLTKGSVKLAERFQWSLLIAGTETNDVIHQEWIASKISDPGIHTLLALIQQKKKSSGGESHLVERFRCLQFGKWLVASSELLIGWVRDPESN